MYGELPMMRWGVLLALILVPSWAGATTYYADPAGGGAASCVDSGANVCTLARAITVSSTGDTIQASCGTYDLGSSALAVNKNVTIAPVTAADGNTTSCGIITSSNATSTVDITASNDANTLTFGGFEVRNTGSAGQIVRIVSALYDATVVVDGTYIPTGGTNRHIQDAWTRGTIQITNLIIGGTIGAQGAIYSVTTPASAKSITISGATGTVTAGASNTPVILIERAAANSVVVSATVTNCNLVVNIPSALGTSAVGMGVRFNRIDDALAEGNTITVNSRGASAADSLGLVASSTDATATAHRPIFRNNTVTCNGPATRCISAGVDGTTASNVDNAQIYGNIVYNNYYDGLATPHGIAVNRVTGGIVRGNIVHGFAVPYLASMNNGAVFTGNLAVGGYYALFYTKGSGGTTAPLFSNNTGIMDDTLFGARMGSYGCLAAAVQSGTNNTATNFYNNNCYVKSGTGWKYVVVDSSQAATFDANNYYSAVSLANDPWSYTGTTYATATLWNAVGTVGTDLNSDPLFVGTSDYRLRGSSTLRRAGKLDVSCYDYRGRPCWQAPDIGAYQATSGDHAATRTAR